MITKPMLAVAVADLSAIKYPVYASPKLDGIRCLIVNGKALTRKFEPIPNHYVRTFLEAHCLSGFDGELIVPGADFNATQSAIMSEDGEPDFLYVLFDYVRDGLDIPYERRLDVLYELFADTAPEHIVVIETLSVGDEALLLDYERDCLERGFEGVMLRSYASPYKCGRSTVREGYLLKLKRFLDSEAVVIGFEERMHNANPATKDALGHTKRSSVKANLVGTNTLGALIVRDLKTGVEFAIGTGFTDAQRAELWDRRYLGSIVTYTYQGCGMKNKPRFPSFKGFRDPRDM